MSRIKSLNLDVGFEVQRKVLSPIVSGFETEEKAASDDRWLRARVQASLDDPRPSIPHDQVMAEMDALVADLENRPLHCP